MSLMTKNMLAKTFKKDMAFIGLLLATGIVLMFVNFWYTTVKDKHDKYYIAISGELRILSQSIAKQAVNAADGVQEAFPLLRKRRDDFNEGLLALKVGDAKSQLPASPLKIQKNELMNLSNTWRMTQDRVDTILARQDILVSFHDLAEKLRQSIPQAQERYEKVVQELIDKKESPQLISLATKQSILTQKLMHNFEKVAQGRTDVMLAAEQFMRDAVVLAERLKIMKQGDARLGIEPVRTSLIVRQLNEIEAIFKVVLDNVERIRETSAEFELVNAAALDIYSASQTLLDQATTLTKAYSLASETRFIGEPTGYMLGLTCILLFFWLAYRGYSDAKQTILHTAAQHKANRAAVWRLLDELANLADGDLTVHATVGEDMTGAIAESVNYAIDALRKLVFTINETAVNVSSSAQESQTTATQLAKASEFQAREIVGATAAINAMAQSIERVSSHASKSASVAEESVNIAKSGVEVVQDNMVGMEKIREQMQETSRQIKRLGQSTQEIGNIIALINDIADQTHILSLNASIQAAMAGEAGKGFAVVAEEVQHLAERAAQATKQVEILVHTIQTDTNETVKSMEQTTQEVVSGANLAKNSGEALAKIENVSSHLAELIHKISVAAGEQAETSSQVSMTMEVIKDITTQTASGTTATANSIGHLAELAIELRESVAGFKLPIDQESESEFFSRTG